MRFVDRLEKRLGRFAVPHLMLYIMILYGAGFILRLISPSFYFDYLCFSAPAILRGQVWRLVTFLIQPPSYDILYFLIAMYLYYMIGNTLERAWGTFLFNLYFFLGVVMHIAAGFLIWFVFKYDVALNTGFLNASLFLAFAATFPEMQFLLFFIVPIKAKWLGIGEGVLYAYMLVTSAIAGDWANVILIVLSLANFLIFFLMVGRGMRLSPVRRVRPQTAAKVRPPVSPAASAAGTRHRCAVCGITEKDAPDMEFRFCSRCEGEYEYCSDHLYTHQHVKKTQTS